MIPDDKIAEIRERTDIVALVEEFVPLRRVGASFKGLCPFHAEKTPSFYVNPARQFYHCFGCQASGDVISFVMRLEGRDFPDVARQLAERAGVELPRLDSVDEVAHRRARAREERLVAVMEAAAGFFIKQLGEHPLAGMARDELTRRGIGRAAAETFRLGYAPHGWDALTRWLADRGYAVEEAEEMGLIVPRKSGTGHYDRFRHRLVFPIADHQGRIVAFSGRMLDPPPDEPLSARSEPGAKYVNSPESPLYTKGSILFGLHEGRVAIRREKWALLCEGNFDLLALHQAGFQNAVAPMGTALTVEHAKLLRRYCERVVLLFDGDAAGLKAVRACAPLLQDAALPARVVTLPRGEDPDSFLRAKGADAMRTLVAGAPGLVEHLVDEAAASSGGDAAEKAAAIEALGPILARAGNPVEVRLYVERVAQKFGISDLHAVRAQLRRGLRGGRGGRRDRPGAEPPRRQGGRAPEARFPQLEADVLGAILDHDELLRTPEAGHFGSLLTDPDLRSIFLTAARMVELRGAVDATGLLAQVEGGAARGWLNERLAIQKYDLDGATHALRDGIPALAQRNIELELPKLSRRILALRREGQHDEANELTRERDRLFTSSKQLRQVTKG